MRQITELQIHSDNFVDEAENVSSLALSNGLLRHPCLQRLVIETPKNYWPLILPAIRSIPSLKRVCLTKVIGVDSDFESDVEDDDSSESDVVPEDDGILYIELIAETTPPTSKEVELVLRDFNFASEDVNQRLCDLIVNGQLQGIAFERCCLRECTVFFEALARSPLQSFCFSFCHSHVFLSDNPLCNLSLLQSVGRAIAMMSELRTLANAWMLRFRC